jgi:transcriptional regulator with XRE-family HTH domain
LKKTLIFWRRNVTFCSVKAYNLCISNGAGYSKTRKMEEFTPNTTPTGTQLKTLRLKSGRSQAKLAELAGITRGQMDSLERGRSNPENLAKVMEALKGLGIEYVSGIDTPTETVVATKQLPVESTTTTTTESHYTEWVDPFPWWN